MSRSRKYAQQHGTSLNELIRMLLKRQVNPEENDPVQKLLAHTQSLSIKTKDWKWNRADIYDRKVFS